MLLEGLHELHELLAGLVVDGDGGLGLPDELGGLRLAELVLERLGHLVEIALVAIDLVAVFGGDDVVRAGIDGGLQHGVGIGNFRSELDVADPVEHEGDGAGLGEVAAALGEVGADVGGRAVAVVGHRLDDDGRASGPVALVADLVVILRIAAGRLVDGALDVVLGHVLGAGGEDRGAQARVHVGIGHAHLGRDGDFAGELGEHLGAHRVHLALAVHDILEL